MSTDAARWGRIQELLAAEGIEAKVDERRVVEGYTAKHVTVRSIDVRVGRTNVHIADASWSKNIDKWIGYRITVEDAEGIIIGRPITTKVRTEVVQAVVRAVRVAA